MHYLSTNEIEMVSGGNNTLYAAPAGVSDITGGLIRPIKYTISHLLGAVVGVMSGIGQGAMSGSHFGFISGGVGLIIGVVVGAVDEGLYGLLYGMKGANQLTQNTIISSVDFANLPSSSIF